jgi:hypothetical protein
MPAVSIASLVLWVMSASAASDPAPSANAALTTSPSGGTTSAKHVKKQPAPIPLSAQEDYWIDPDRPHIADSSVNVPKGLWLQENGFQQSFPNRRTGSFDFPESLIRIGVASRTEVRYNVPNFVAANTDTTGGAATTHALRGTFENMQVGFKHRLGPLGASKFQIAVNPYISVPAGFAGQPNRVDPFLKFPFSQELNEKWDIEGMQSFFDPTDANGRRNFDWQTSLVLNHSWGRQKNAFVEYVGDVFAHGAMSNLIHFGAAYRPKRRQQIDVQFGFRLNNAAPIAFLGFGYSFLLGNLKTPELTPSLYTH